MHLQRLPSGNIQTCLAQIQRRLASTCDWKDNRSIGYFKDDSARMRSWVDCNWWTRITALVVLLNRKSVLVAHRSFVKFFRCDRSFDKVDDIRRKVSTSQIWVIPAPAGRSGWEKEQGEYSYKLDKHFECWMGKWPEFQSTRVSRAILELESKKFFK